MTIVKAQRNHDYVSQYTCNFITVFPFVLPCKVIRICLSYRKTFSKVSLYIGNMPLKLMAKFSWVVIFLTVAIY